MPPYPNDRPSSPRQGRLLLPDGFDRDSGFGPSAFADIDSEESLVACVLKDATILDGPAGNLSPSDFCDTVCGNAHTAALAVRDASGVGAVNIVSVTEEMNRRTGHPPGTISGELLRICRRVYLVKEADRYVARIGGAAEGRRLDAAYRESLAANADPTLDADEVTAALLARLGDEVDHPPPFCLLDSAASDDARFETEYLIEEVLVRGQPAVWAASMKGCKTITAVALGVHGATGTPLFGYARFAVPKPFRTAIVSMESGGGALQAHARSVCRSLGCRLSDVGDGLFWSLDPLKLTDPAALKGLRRETERRRLDVLVIDPLYLAIVVSEGDPASIYRMGRLLVVMTKLAADTGVTPVLVHHAVKRRDSPHEPMQLHELNGAGGGEYARQWGLLSRRVPFDGENPGHHELWLTVGGSAGHSGTYAVDLDEFSPAGFRREWRASVRPASEVKAAIVADREAERETRRAAREKAAVETAITRYAPKVIEYLRKPENRTGRSASSIRNACGMDLKASRAVLPYLLDSGQMVGCRDRAANKQWYDGYRLPGWHPDASEASGSPGCHPGAADDHGTHSDEGPSLGAHPRVCASASSPRTCRRESARPKPPAAGKRGA